MRILVTNDDGYDAPGLLELAALAGEFGDVLVVAPEEEHSACGIVYFDHLQVKRHRAVSLLVGFFDQQGVVLCMGVAGMKQA
jgi:5'/3'-nucleotidase SurE